MTSKKKPAAKSRRPMPKPRLVHSAEPERRSVGQELVGAMFDAAYMQVEAAQSAARHMFEMASKGPFWWWRR